MIRFENLSKGYWYNGVRMPVIDDLTLTLETGQSLALLGRNGAGKSTLMHLIAGNLRPDSGRIIYSGTMSWPIGAAGSLHQDLTGSQNTRFLARVYGVDSEELLEFVSDFADLGEHFYMPVRTYSSGMRSRLTFGLSMGIKFDTYLIDEVTGAGDASFRSKSTALFRERMHSSDSIMVNHNLNELKDYCTSAIVLENGKLKHFASLDEAIEVHQRNMLS